MRFLFVDQIHDRTETQISGRRAFAGDDPMQYGARPGDPGTFVAPGAVSEAIGQLASWLCLERNAFTARPVFLFADRIAVTGRVPVGAVVDLNATIEELDAESFRFSGEARVGGQLVQRINACSGYFMPLGELEDPEESKRRFVALTGGGLRYDGMGGTPYPFETLAGETLELTPGEHVRATRTMAVQEPFYADHFPRFPVTPIVMLNEMIGATTARLVPGKRLLAREIVGIKIRSFVRPGERVETVVKRVGGDTNKDIQCVAEIHKEGRCILRGTYHYELTE